MALGSFLLLVAAVPLVGAVISDGTPGVIEAREFRVVDKNGTPRASVSDDGIHVRDENGTIRAVMEAEGIGYYDETRDERAVMDIGGIRCGNRKGNSRTEMDIHGIRCRDMEGNRADYAAYGIDMTDDDDTPRLTMTPNTLAISDEDSQLRAMIQTGGISYYDWNGELVWEVCQSIG